MRAGLPIERPQLPQKPSIAVLSNENLSGDPEQEHVSDAISDEIITPLARAPWLFSSRNTTLTY